MLATDAPAKVNWTLEVLGRRGDGYREIASVMSTVSLRDTLGLDPAEDWRLSTDAAEPLRSELETDRNLIARAVVEFARAARPDPQVRLHQPAGPPRWSFANARGRWSPPADVVAPPAHLWLTKRIPLAAGLGGGSSDAAATLRLLRHYWKTSLGPGATPDVVSRRLEEVAARLGSDVPFFVSGGTQLARGRGERLEPLPDPVPRWLVILHPPIHVPDKTARLYSMITPGHYTDGVRSERLARRLSASDGAIGEDDVYNVFEVLAASAFPGIDEYRERLSAATGSPAHLCGAGPSLFALSPGIDAAREAAASLSAEGLWARAACIIGRPKTTRVAGMLRGGRGVPRNR